jgi:hypothetical protein
MSSREKRDKKAFLVQVRSVRAGSRHQPKVGDEHGRCAWPPNGEERNAKMASLLPAPGFRGLGHIPPPQGRKAELPYSGSFSGREKRSQRAARTLP